MKYLREDFVFLSVKAYLENSDWRILGGEPPDGTADDLVRICIRAPNASGRLHSLNSLKIDLISIKKGTLLLTEVKPHHSKTDMKKLNLVAGPRRDDLLRAIRERCKIQSESVKSVVKSLGHTAMQISVPRDFIVFLVHSNGKVTIESGDLIDQTILG